MFSTALVHSQISCNNFYITSNQSYSTTVNSGANVSSLPVTVNSSLPFTYNWYLNSTPIFNGANYSGTNTNQLTVFGVNYSQTNFKCIVINTDGCYDTTYFQIDVCDDIAQQPNDVIASVNSNATFSLTHNDPNSVYQWRTDIGTGFQNVTNAGQYSGATTNTLTVSNLSLLNNNQYFHCRIYSNCNTYEYSDTVVLMVVDSTNSIFENQINEIIVYPNPVNNEFKLQSSKLQFEYSYVIYNAIGEEIKSDVAVSLDDVINCESLEKGIYFIKVIGDEQILKFIKN